MHQMQPLPNMIIAGPHFPCPRQMPQLQLPVQFSKRKLLSHQPDTQLQLQPPEHERRQQLSATRCWSGVSAARA